MDIQEEKLYSSIQRIHCKTMMDGCMIMVFKISIYSRPDRLREIADRFNLDHTAMLDNVLYARAYTSKIIIRSYSLNYTL